MRTHRLGRLPSDRHVYETPNDDPATARYRYHDYTIFSPSHTTPGHVIVTTFDSISGLPVSQAEVSEMSKDFEKQHKGWECMLTFHAVLGYIVVGRKGYLLVAVEVTKEATVFNHSVYNVQQMKLIELDLIRPFAPDARSTEHQALRDIQNHITTCGPIYFYCDTMDITRPFAFRLINKGRDYSHVCNEELIAVLSPDVASVLVQGYFHSTPMPNAFGLLVGSVSLFVRRVMVNYERCSHRGLNAMCCPANEYECELILTEVLPNCDPTFSTFVFRRGTVPLFWRSHDGIFSEDILLRRFPHRHSEWYYHNLVERYEGHINPCPKHTLRLMCVNLLRSHSCPSEEALGYVYEQAPAEVSQRLKEVDPRNELQNVVLDVCSHDWARHVATCGLGKCVELLWEKLLDKLEECGFTQGTIDKVTGAPHVTKRQNTVFRLNCNDSVDRTNVGGFYLCVQVVLRIVTEGPLTVSHLMTASLPAKAGAFNHVRDAFKAPFSKALVELFIQSGDRIADLYTQSAALDRASIAYFAKQDNPNNANFNVGISRYIEKSFHEAYRVRCQQVFLNRENKYFVRPTALVLDEDTPNQKLAVIGRNMSIATPLTRLGSFSALRMSPESKTAFIYYDEADSVERALKSVDAHLAMPLHPEPARGSRWYIPSSVASTHEVDMIIDPRRRHTFRALEIPRGSICVACNETIYNPFDGLRCTCCAITVHQDPERKCYLKAPVQRCREVIMSNYENLGPLETRFYYTAEEPQEPVGFYRMTSLLYDGVAKVCYALTR